MANKPAEKLAFLFRYGAAEHVDFLPALPLLVDQLSAEGLELHHYGFKGQGSLPDRLKGKLQVHHLGLSVHRGKATDKWLKATLWILLLPFLGLYLQIKGFKIVFVDETLPLSALILRLSFRGRLVFTLHDFFGEMYLGKQGLRGALQGLIQKLDEWAWRRLDGICTRVQPAKDYVVGLGVAEEKVYVIPDSVDTQLFTPSTRTETSEEIWMVHHGIMHPNKGNVLLVESLARLKERIPQLRLLLIGEGPEYPAVQQRVQELGVSREVELTGWLPDLPSIAKRLRECHIGLVMRKGLPGDAFHVTSTLVHNLACALPICAARLPGIVSAMGEQPVGFSFDPASPGELDAALLQLVEDQQGREQMGACARRLAEEQFSPESNARAYLKVLGLMT